MSDFSDRLNALTEALKELNTMGPSDAVVVAREHVVAAIDRLTGVRS